MAWPHPAWAVDLRPFLANSSRPIKVLHPCAGLNAPERAARELQMRWVSSGDYEVNPALAATLRKVSSNADQLHVGAMDGDILAVDVSTLDLETDAVISGPPCPPFSSIGKRLIECDMRSCVFIAVMHWIVYLATSGMLAF